MNGRVHYGLTKQWALDVGFSPEDAETIAQANIDVDRTYKGQLLHNASYHFRWLGARRRAKHWFSRALESRDVTLLGQALHCEQDAWGHGHLGVIWHWPGIDLWERRSPRAQSRIEQATRAMLSEYHERLLVADERQYGEDEHGV